VEVATVAYNTYRSRLIPYENEIVALRRKKPPTPYSKIAELLREKYLIEVRSTTIIRFLQVRAKGYKTCKYAWDVEPITPNNQPTTEVSLLQKTKAENKPEPVRQPLDSSKPKHFKMEFSETYNLTRVSPEEAAARLKKLEEKENQ
jgi:hypothetical protein